MLMTPSEKRVLLNFFSTHNPLRKREPRYFHRIIQYAELDIGVLKTVNTGRWIYPRRNSYRKYPWLYSYKDKERILLPETKC